MKRYEEVQELGFDPATAAATAEAVISTYNKIKHLFGGKKHKVKNPHINKSMVLSPELVRAVSWHNRYAEIPLQKPAKDVQLLKQYSKSKCIKGQTFGLTPDGKKVWVNKGCRADLKVIPKPDIVSSVLHIGQSGNGQGGINLTTLLLPLAIGLVGAVVVKKVF